MLKNMKKIWRVAPLVLILGMAALPAMAATNSTFGDRDIDTNEGTIIAASVFIYLVGSALIFWLLPQRKEKKAVPAIIAIGVALSIMAVLFYFTAFLTNWDIAFWTKWIDWAGHTQAVLIAAAGAFLILLMTAYAAYNEKNEKKERDIIGLGFIAMLVWSILVLLPALIGFSI